MAAGTPVYQLGPAARAPEWEAKGREIEPLEVRLEASDVRVDELTLVWAPTP